MYPAVRAAWLVAACCLVVLAAEAREWSDATGTYVVEADLIGFDDENVVVQRADKELGMLRIDELSDEDRAYLKSTEAEQSNDRNIEQTQTWETKSGLKLVGRIVDYARGEVTVQQRRGSTYVNDRRLDNLPELYQKLLPKVVEHFDEVEIPDNQALNNWLRSLRGRPRTFDLEGVTLEMESGDEYSIPFFVFAARDRKMLKAGWADWLTIHEDHQQRDDHAYRLEALAAAYAQDQQINRQIATMNLNLQAIQAGLTSAWEVTLYPAPGNPRPPMWVVMPGRNSREATAAAVANNPGFVAGPVRRVSRRRR